jgi:ABC-type oligopeptide transport system substrate-binding subunit
MYTGDPENPLIPSNTTESEGSQIIDSIWTGLTQYNIDTAETEYTGVAESIESTDSTTWTVTLKDGWTFHDGTPVTAESFVKAWNWAANSENAQGGSYFFTNIEGYDELQGEEGAPPAATEMTGLKVIDDKSFTVTLKAPFAQFPVTVGYNPFFPLPEAFYADPEAFGEKPIGNGPFKADEAYVPGEGITLSRYDDYAGEQKANAQTLEYRAYTDIGTGFLDVQAGNLDVQKDLPPDAVGSAKDEFGERYVERPSSAFTYVGFPLYDPRFGDKRIRQAFSMAIDREAITEAVFSGTRVPAASAISPVVDGSRDDPCTYCVYDPTAAKALLDQTDFDVSTPVDLWFNAGAGHEEWVQAVGNQLRTNLGIEYNLRGDLQFAEYLPLQEQKGMTGPFRLAWSMDYPSPQNYLEPLYSTSALPPAGDNKTFYANPAFDALLTEANAAADNDEAIALYQQAEDLLLEDMPIVPLWFGLEQAVFSERVSNVKIDAFGRVDGALVTVLE